MFNRRIYMSALWILLFFCTLVLVLLVVLIAGATLGYHEHPKGKKKYRVRAIETAVIFLVPLEWIPQILWMKWLNHDDPSQITMVMGVIVWLLDLWAGYNFGLQSRIKEALEEHSPPV